MVNVEPRPAIPADLRRRALVESGHRCAIHTCRHTGVDIHHIEPWSKCCEHRFENLIALCPNCHRRADAGEIDRKSLHMYKARLAATFRFDESKIYPDDVPNMPSFGWLDPQARWRTLMEQDSDDERSFEARMEYPEFHLHGVNTGPLNDMIRKTVRTVLRQFCDDVVFGPSADEIRSTIGYQIDSSFAVALLQPSLGSIRFTFHAYAGGAHGSTWTKALNVYLDSFLSFDLADLFIDDSVGIGALSSYCIGTLMRSGNQSYSRDEDWVMSGAGPKDNNFSTFNVTDQGLLITFDEYKIDCYAAGRSEVLVPYTEFKGNINDRFQKALSTDW